MESGVPMPSWQQKATGADPIARGSVPPGVVWDPGMHRRLLHGNRESSVTALRGRLQGRDGKANVYLHYVYDLWVQQWRKRDASGDMIVVRYADDTIVGFQHRREAERFLRDLEDRLAEFALSLHPEKTRLIEFGA